ncbi:rod shape-determining protein RodA [bacterium]|nr:rod shape-determining protein RodA [bacterium]
MNRLQSFKYINIPLLALTVILTAIGVFFIYSASYQITIETQSQVNYYSKQIIWVAVSFCIFLFVLFYGYENIMKQSFLILGLNIILLIMVYIFGNERYGAQRWLQFGGLVLQPSEITKVTIILALSRYVSLNIHNYRSFRFMFTAFLIVFVPMILILRQPDLGTALVFIPIFFSIIFVAGTPIKHILKLIVPGLVSAPVFWFLLKDYQKNRIRVFWDPNLDPTGLGYQSIQSKIAIGSGGLFGKGWLHGTQNQLNFLPKRYTDFIFSIIGEEWGFLGACIILLIYFAIIIIGIYIASKSRDIYGKLVATGISIMLLSHVIINVGMTIGVMPITGLPLLFLSYGGSSMLTAMISVALLQSIWMKRRYDY